ncbi:hypothetical protein B4U79_08519 [Dinothrombium tinctorium]|uniref:Uncharacterized protein n=1 Tax=Dinothrombium tinctorium TaxID=1965070 RepID=A0A3S3NJ27_9ACAR|nr:hypothetical protein B4U79_08519 [Dinothrombium tinctorium]
MDYFYWKGGPFLPSHDLIDLIAERVCEFRIFGALCSNILFLFAGFDSKQLNETRLPVYLAHEPAGSSAWNVVHFGQEMLSKEFRKFDFGEKENLKKYGSKYPPVYNLTKIKSRNIALLYSENDWLADPKDVQFIREQLRGERSENLKIIGLL